MTQTLWETESDFIRLIARIKERGTKIDSAFSRKKVIEGTRILNTIKSGLGWNPGSPQQLGKYLLDDLSLPVLKRTPNGAPSFDKEALEEYELYLDATGDETAQKVLTYRGWQKTVSSNFQAYLDLMDENEILHPNYKVHGTRTCRLSCEKPNLQQIPRESVKPWNGDVKKAFIPREEHLFLDLWRKQNLKRNLSGRTKLRTFDFKQVEFRLAAAYAKEKELIEIFNSGADIFTEMSLRLGRPRHQIKTFVYSTLYGAGRAKVALVLGMPRYESDEFYDEYHGTWPGFRQISEKATQLAKNDGYIDYWTGRRRHLSKGEAHKAFNAIIQGGAFEIIKRRMLALRDEPIVLQVHDSITIEDDDNCDIDRIKRTLEDVPENNQFGVKFEVDMTVEGAQLN
ncbi:MAG: DNA polymerase-1 [Candidatus Nitrosomirales archaeon]|jgi:DNA polymerase-1